MKNKLIKYLSIVFIGIVSFISCFTLYSSKNDEKTAKAIVVHDEHTGTVLTDGGTLESGEYYLTSDVTLTEHIEISENTEVTICLNGYDLYLSNTACVQCGGNLTIEDCGTNKRIYKDSNNNEYEYYGGNIKFVDDEYGSYALKLIGKNNMNVTINNVNFVESPYVNNDCSLIYFYDYSEISNNILNITNCNFFGNNFGTLVDSTAFNLTTNISDCNFIDNGLNNSSSNSVINNINSAVEDVLQKYQHNHLNITNCVFKNNFSATNGGVIYFNTDHNGGGGTLTIDNCIFDGNTSSYGSGGAIYSNGPTNIYSSTFTNNTASNKYGGAIYAHSAILLKDCTLTNNSADIGGAIYFSSYQNVMTLDNVTVTNNHANTYAGGIYSEYSECCFAQGTKVTMADGSYKNIEDIEYGDLVQTFDHESGCISSEEVYYIFKSDYKHTYFTLNFETTSVDVVFGHCFLEESSLKYVELTETDAENYIGKSFYNANTQSFEKLVSVSKDNTPVYYYSIYTAHHLNSIANDMLSIHGDTVGYLNLYELDENLKADMDILNSDIEKYGLATVEETGCLDEDYFDKLNEKYFYIGVGKGTINYKEAVNIAKDSGMFKEGYTIPSSKPIPTLKMAMLGNTLNNQETTITNETYAEGWSTSCAYVVLVKDVNITNNTSGSDTPVDDNLYLMGNNSFVGLVFENGEYDSNIHVGISMSENKGEFLNNSYVAENYNITLLTDEEQSNDALVENRNCFMSNFTSDKSADKYEIQINDYESYFTYSINLLCNITYDLNGGTGTTPVDTTEYFEGTEIDLLEQNNFYKTNYKFVGWSTNSSDTSGSYEYTVDSNNLTLYAVWKELTGLYWVKEVNNQTYVYGDDSDIIYGVVGEIIDIDFVYNGSGYEISYTADESLILNYDESISLFAWQLYGSSETAGTYSITVNYNNDLKEIYLQKTFTLCIQSKITFDGNDATSGSVPDYIISDKDSEITLPGNTGNLAKTGYTFIGWSTTKDGTAITSFTVPNTNSTLYAIWEVETYTVSYDANAGTDTVTNMPSSVDYVYGGTVTLSSTTPSRTNYNFACWNTKEDGSGTSYSANDTFTMGPSNVTLYAIWEELYGDDIEITIDGLVEDASTSDISITFNDPTNLSVERWNMYYDNDQVDSIEYAGIYTFNILIKNNSGLNFDCDFNADYAGTVSSTGNEILNYWGCLSANETFSYFTHTPSKYIYVCINVEVKGEELTYDGNGGTDEVYSVPETSNCFVGQSIEIDTETIPTRNGYNFVGWNTNKDATDKEDFTDNKITMVNGGITLYAIWEKIIKTQPSSANDYTVVVGDHVSYVTYQWEKGTYEYEDATYYGLYYGSIGNNSFYPWDNTVSANTNSFFQVDNNDSNTVLRFKYNGTGTITDCTKDGDYYYPTFDTENNYFSVHIDNKGDDDQFTDIEVYVLNFSYIEEETNSQLGSVTDNAYYRCEITTDYEILYSDTLSTKEIKFDGNGKVNGSVSSLYQLEGRSITIPSNSFTKAGYVFVEWNTKEDGTGTSYKANDTYTVGTDDLTIYAIWEAYCVDDDLALTYDEQFEYGYGTTGSDILSALSTNNSKLEIDDVLISQLGADYDLEYFESISKPGTYYIIIIVKGAKSDGTNERWLRTLTSNKNRDYVGTILVGGKEPISIDMGSTWDYEGGGGFNGVTSDLQVTRMAIYIEIELIGKTITYADNVNDQELVVPTDSNTYLEGQPVTLSTSKVTYTGYKFIGWNTSSTATTALNNYNYDSSNSTLYAIYKKAYSVKYDNYDSKITSPVDDTQYLLNESATVNTNEIVLSGYFFMGWSLSKDGEVITLLTISDEIAKDYVITLYPIYKTISKEVQEVRVNENTGFIVNGPEGISGYKVYYKSGTTDQWTSEIPTAPGYYSVKVSRDADENYSAFEVIINGGYGIYLTVTYDGNNADSGQAPESVKYFTLGFGRLPLNGNTLVKEGFEISGWLKENSGSLEFYELGSSSPVLFDTTFYACWTPVIKEDLSKDNDYSIQTDATNVSYQWYKKGEYDLGVYGTDWLIYENCGTYDETNKKVVASYNEDNEWYVITIMIPNTLENTSSKLHFNLNNTVTIFDISTEDNALLVDGNRYEVSYYEADDYLAFDFACDDAFKISDLKLLKLTKLDNETSAKISKTYDDNELNCVLTYKNIINSIEYVAQITSNSIKPIKITYRNDSESEDIIDTVYQLEGRTITLPNNTDTKTSYEFVGWSDGTNTYKENVSYTIPNSDVTLTGVWELKKTSIAPSKEETSETIKDEVIVSSEEGFSSSITVTVEVTVEAEVKKADLTVDYYNLENEDIKLDKNEVVGVVYDVKLIQTIDGVSREIQPSDIKEGTKIKVRMLIPEDVDVSKLTKILHVHSADDIEVIEFDSSKLVDGYYEIEVDKLSEFAFVYKNSSNYIWIIIIAAIVIALIILFIILRNRKDKDDSKKEVKERSLHDSIVDAGILNSKCDVNKKVVADYLEDIFKDEVICNRRANYISNGYLPLADTHYKVNGKKKQCFVYVYELRNNKVFFLVKVNDKLATKLSKKYSGFAKSAFPKNKANNWYSLVLDKSFKSNKEVLNILKDIFENI